MSARTRLVLDTGLFAGLLAVNYPGWTGISIHEWLGIALITPLLVHLIANWDWTVRTVTNFVDKARNASRLNLVIDTLLFLSVVAVTLSGLMVSTVVPSLLNIDTAPSVIWYALHSVAADATILLMLVHLGLHWRWVARTLRRLFAPGRSPGRLPRPAVTPALVNSPSEAAGTGRHRPYGRTDRP